jgi:hypothetical protein
MANTVSNISYANTFGDWVVATDALIRENNTLGKGNYTKDSGTLTLGETTLKALSAQGDVEVQKQLLVQGVASSATIDNNLTVGKQVYFTNTTLGLTHSGQANMNGLIVAQGPNIGIRVANNAYVGGNATIQFNTVTDKVQANTSVTTPLVSSDTVTNSGSVYTNQVRANSLVTSVTINNTGAVYTATVQANTSVTTPLVSSNTVNNLGTVTTNVLNATSNVNTSLVSSTIVNNSGTVYTDTVTSNTLVSTTTVNTSGTVYTNIISANTNVISPAITSTNITANTNVISPLVSSTTVNNSGTVRTNTLAANTNVTAPTVSISTLLDANNASGFLGNLYAQNMTVSGNFVQTGSTIYAANTFILSQNVASAIDSYYSVDRGPGQTQASFRWTETPKNWQIRNVTSGTYYRVHTDEYLTSSITDTSTSNIANALAANTLNNLIAAAAINRQSAYDQANSSITLGQSAYSQANTALATALSAKTTFAGTSGAPFTSNTLTFSSNNGVTIAPVGANTVAISTPQDLRTSASPTFTTLSLTSTPLGTGSGGTGQTSGKAAFEYMIVQSAGSGTSGQVLTTGGGTNFYWAAGGGGGGGTTPGTTISSSRLSYSGDNTNTKYTAPTFNQANQLRAYINGVRQFESEYTANSSNSTIVFNAPPLVGDSILIEVDGYILNPYYANNIPVSPTGTISGNTIQLAINTLESAKAALSGATFTGDVSGLTTNANTSNTLFATTQFVKNVLNQSSAVSGVTYAISTTGNAGTVTNGVYTNGSYSDPAWITSLANTKISGVITNSQLDSTAVVPKGYGTAASVPTFIVNAQGRITSAANVSIAIDASGITTGTLSVARLPYNMDQAVATANNVQFNSLGIGTAASGTTGEIRATSTVTSGYSDDQLKTKLGNIDNALDKLMTLNGFYYEPSQLALDLGYTPSKQVGVSAQEVQKVLPEVVVPAPVDDKYLTVQYEKMIPLLIEAIKELKSEVEVLKGQIK